MIHPHISAPEELSVSPGVAGCPVRVSQPDHPGKPRGRFWWLLAAVLIVVTGALLYWRGRETARARQTRVAPGAVRTATVRVGTLDRSLRLTGITVAERYANLLTPSLSGHRGYGIGDFALVLLHLAKPGSRVKKGEIVAEFDRQWMQNRLDDYGAAVRQDELYVKTLKVQLGARRQGSEQSIRAAKADVDKAALDLKTIPVRSAIAGEQLKLARDQAGSRYKQMLNIPLFLDISEGAAIRRSEIGLQVEQLEFKRAQANVDKMVLHAPMDGLVVLQKTYHGSELAEIQAGDQVAAGQSFMQIVDQRSMVINATANQADAELLKIGARARVQLDAYPGLELAASVYSVGAIAVAGGWRQSWVKGLPVRLRVEQTDPRVIPNFSASADVILNSEPGTLIIPRECVFSDAGDQKLFVFVKEAGGWDRREIQLGMANHTSVAVRSGLREGEVLATQRPEASLTPGP